MTDNNQNHPSDPSSFGPSGDPNGSKHRFEGDTPRGEKKDVRRGSFSSFTPRRDREASFSRKAEQPAAAHSVSSPAPASPSPLPSVAPPSPPSEIPPAPAPTLTARPVTVVFDSVFERQRLFFLLAVMLPLGLFAFWPAFSQMVREWRYNLDYSHGFFVLPLIALFLYLRMDSYPGTQRRLEWIGLIPILISCVMRLGAVRQSFDAVDQWSILFWALGVVWLFYGSRVFYWAAPSLLFMVFMFPLPYSIEVILRNRLQAFAAKFAAGILQLLGETAIPIRNTIHLSTMELGVEAACSGIRFLVSILAIAFAAILLMRRPWWQNLCVFLLVPPLALFVNAMRIALTGILLLHFSETVKWFAPNSTNISTTADEFSGIVMIFVAFGMFFAVIWYLGKVFRKIDL